MPLTAEQSAKLTNWYNAQTQAEIFKNLESKLRNELVKELFDPNKDSGSESIDIGGGYLLKSTKKLDYKLNNKEGQVEAVIAIMLPDIAKQLVKWEPKLSESTYKNSDSETRKLFDGCLTIKPAKPSLEIVAPKAE